MAGRASKPRRGKVSEKIRALVRAGTTDPVELGERTGASRQLVHAARRRGERAGRPARGLKKLSIAVPEDTEQWLRGEAERRGCSLGDVVAEVVARRVRPDGQQHVGSDRIEHRATQMDHDDVEQLEVRRLARALALAEGFALYLVTCDSAERGWALVEQARQLCASERGAQLDRISTPASASSTLSREARRAVLELLHTPHAGSTQLSLVCLDASVARHEDEGGWRELFRRMNEQRNAIVRILGIPLVFISSRELLRAFVEEAPDFWSVRSLSILLPSQDRDQLGIASQPHSKVRAVRGDP